MEEKCMTPECEGKAKWKGLCQSCYGVAKRVMDQDKLSWEDLQEMGLCKGDVKPFKVAYLKAKALRMSKEPEAS